MTDQIITPLPEVVDRYTICQLKLERLDHTQIDVDSMKDPVSYTHLKLPTNTPV